MPPFSGQPLLGPVAAAPVLVIHAATHVAVGVRVRVFAVHPLIPPAGDDVPEVVDHAVGDEEFAVLVPVEAPGVGGAGGEDFEHFSRRVERQTPQSM